jgi:hypothetical protein
MGSIDWRFWFGLIAMLVAIAIYVGTNTCRWCLRAARGGYRPVAEIHSVMRLATSTGLPTQYQDGGLDGG